MSYSGTSACMKPGWPGSLSMTSSSMRSRSISNTLLCMMLLLQPTSSGISYQMWPRTLLVVSGLPLVRISVKEYVLLRACARKCPRYCRSEYRKSRRRDPERCDAPRLLGRSGWCFQGGDRDWNRDFTRYPDPGPGRIGRNPGVRGGRHREPQNGSVNSRIPGDLSLLKLIKTYFPYLM